MKNSNFILIVLVWLVIGWQLVNGQNYNALIYPAENTGWVKFKPLKGLDVNLVFSSYKTVFGLKEPDNMALIRTDGDALGYRHCRFQQYYKGIPVEGAQYLIHEHDGFLKTGNGNIVTGLDISTPPMISPEQAVQVAVAFVHADIYMWENAANERFIKWLKNDPEATYYPQPELVIADKEFSQISTNYHLTYKVEIYAEKPLKRLFVYIDATTGEIYHTVNMIQTTDVTGIAVTKYSDTQTIITDSVSPGAYRLRDASRGNGVETYNMNQGTGYGAAVDFTDDDNYWNNVNAQQDEVATDAHWGAEMTYDYYFTVHGRSSYDGNGAVLLSYVHYDENYMNAFWDGTRMTYGDGGPDLQGNQYTSFASLDVCGHEITHGVTQYTADLVYQDEPGALSESFSDIFGTAIEFFAYPPNADWTMGEDFGPIMRSMSDPNAYQNPDTYLGAYWDEDPNNWDNGGVHTNNGVGNYWFYLLSEGGGGTNDNGDVYNVQGIGITKAELIAFRALSVYLTSTAQYYDAREATINAAEDLYGLCSAEVIETANAWYAVGVGQAISNHDITVVDVISPVTACGMTTEPVTVMLRYNGCDIALNPGEQIISGYSIDGTTPVIDTIILSGILNGGDSLVFTFDIPADVSALGIHTIDCWADYIADTLSYNDTLFNYQLENKLQQNIDVGIVGITNPVSECHLTASEPVTVNLQFFGCDSLLAGTPVGIAYQADGGPVARDTIILPSTVYASEVISYTFNTPADFSLSGTHIINSWSEFDIDTLTSNDLFSGYSIKNPYTLSNDTVNFETTDASDYYLIDIAQYCNAYVSSYAAHNSTKGLQMTGGDAMQYYTELEIPDGSNTWDINECLSVKVSFCVDATGWSTANMSFDLKQTFSTIYQMYAGYDFPMGSCFRVLVNDEQISGTYFPTTYSSDPWETLYFNLDGFAGTNFTVCFETRNIIKRNMIPGYPDVGDNSYIDNVIFSEEPLGFKEFSQGESLEIYPNPSDNYFIAEYFSENSGLIKAEITNMLGKIMLSKTMHAGQGRNTIPVDLTEYPSGIYIIKIFSGQGTITERIVRI